MYFLICLLYNKNAWVEECGSVSNLNLDLNDLPNAYEEEIYK